MGQQKDSWIRVIMQFIIRQACVISIRPVSESRVTVFSCGYYKVNFFFYHFSFTEDMYAS